MGEALVIRTTKFQVVCPACARRGIADWTRTTNLVKCRGCGETFDYRDHTYRPVTGGMSDEERARYEKERERAYCAAHREERAAKSRRHYAENREKCLARHRRYYAEHREEIGERARAYYYAHKDEILAQRRRYRAEHREELRVRAKARRVAEWRAKHGKEKRGAMGDV